MINKRHSKLLKALSAAIVGSITLGNYSTVWMMEDSKKVSKMSSELSNRLRVSYLTRYYVLKNGCIDKSNGKRLDDYLAQHPMRTIDGDKKALELYKEEICNFLAGELKMNAAVIEQLSNDDLELIDKQEGAKSVFVRRFVHSLRDVRTALSRCN